MSSEFDETRERNIERNRSFLKELGIVQSPENDLKITSASGEIDKKKLMRDAMENRVSLYNAEKAGHLSILLERFPQRMDQIKLLYSFLEMVICLKQLFSFNFLSELMYFLHHYHLHYLYATINH